MKILSKLIIFIFITSCATIVNDAEVPVTLSFSDGSSGSCKLSTKEHNIKLMCQEHTELGDQMMH